MWNNWYFDFGYPDLALKAVNEDQLTISNEGGRALAFEILYEYEDGSTQKEIVSPEVWKTDRIYMHSPKVDSGYISARLVFLSGSDAFAENNLWKKN